MPLVFLSKRLDDEEQKEAKAIIEKYDNIVGYAEFPNDSKIDLIIRTKNDILSNQVYKTLNVTFFCLKQMDLKGINPFLFEPRNIGLRNIFLLGMTITLYEIKMPKPITSLVNSMGGKINDSPNPNEADIIITDKKVRTQNFTIPLVSSSWIYAISNQTLEIPFDKYLINKDEKVNSPLSQIPSENPIVKEDLLFSSSQLTVVPPKQEGVKTKKENLPLSSINVEKPKTNKRKRNILNCVRPANKSVLSSAAKASQDCSDFLPRPLLIDADVNDLTGVPNFSIIKEKDGISFPASDTPERLMQNSPKLKLSPVSNHSASPKLNKVMTILKEKSKKKKKSKDVLRSAPSFEELNEFSQIVYEDNDDDEQYTNDVYYDNSKDSQSQTNSTQVDEEVLFNILEAYS